MLTVRKDEVVNPAIPKASASNAWLNSMPAKLFGVGSRPATLRTPEETAETALEGWRLCPAFWRILAHTCVLLHGSETDVSGDDASLVGSLQWLSSGSTPQTRNKAILNRESLCRRKAMQTPRLSPSFTSSCRKRRIIEDGRK